ncbi:unnamed protein product [Closterium sp. NIES-64]|nr:unnamed protein product [Closterium sp. NIES-64]
MASPSVLTFDTEGRAVDFEVWVDDLQLFLQCDKADDLSLFDLTSSAPPALVLMLTPLFAHSGPRAMLLLALLCAATYQPLSVHTFSQYKSAQTLYDAIVARYSSLATAALSRLMLPYLFPDLAAFPTITALITHLRTSDTRYHALRFLLNHFLSICPTTLTIDLLEKTLLAIEKSIFAVGASRGDPRTPVFEGCSPSPLLPSVASAAAADLVGFESVSAASAPSERRRTDKGKGGKGAGGAGGGAVEVVLEAVEGVRVVVGVVPGVVAAAAAVEAAEAVEVAEGAEAAEVVEEAEVERAGRGGSGSGGGGGGCGSWTLRRGVAPVVGDLAKAGVAIFGLDFDAILAAMYAVADSVEGACYLCVPPEPGIEAATLGADEAAALGASASAAPGAGASAAPGAGDSAPSGTTSAQAFHTFTLDSGASRSFFRDRTTLTPLSQPVAVSLADPSGGPVLASFSTVLPCPAAPSGTLSSLYLPLFSTNLGRERYFLLVVDDYSRYTTVFPLCGKGDVTEVLIDWIRAACLQLKESFGSDFPILRLHSDRGGEFSSACLGALCHAQGIRQTFTLPASPQQNWIAERRIGMVMDFARTSMMHAAALHFLWLFAVQYAAHQLNLQPWFSLPETSPALRCTRKLGDASAFWDVTFDESVPYYCLFPYRTAPLPPPPLFLAPGATQLDPLLPQGPATSRVSQVDAVEPVEVAVDSGAARGAEPAGAGSGGAESGGAETWGGKSGGAETWVLSLGVLRLEVLSVGVRSSGVLVGPPGAAVGAGAAGGGAAGGVGAGVSTAAGASRGIAEAAGADGPTGGGSTGAAVAAVGAAVLQALVLLRVLE